MKKRVLILGGGFAGVGLLRSLQKKFKKNINVEISLVSDDNFFLFTPMLPEVASGMLHASDVATPIRTFCKHAQFYHAKITLVDFEKKQVSVVRIFDDKKLVLDYDYLIFALGSVDNFFGNKNMKKYSFTMKTLEDALGIRNHVISMLESADNEHDLKLQDELSNFVIVGGGFAGVETASEINHFVLDASKKYYKNIDMKKLRVILISARDGILPEVGTELGIYAMKSLTKSGIEVITKTKAVDAGQNYVMLDGGKKISCGTLIWAGGVTVDPLISSLECEHGPSGRIVVDKFLKVKGFENVFALGDCAYVLEGKNSESLPPTAQIAIKEAQSVFENIVADIQRKPHLVKPFIYKNRGVMATIGKRNAVALFGKRKIHGVLAWILWRTFYLSHLPNREKKVRVSIEWFLDLFFRHSEILTVGIIKRKPLTKIEKHTVLESKFEKEHL
jgi:NADH:ubiquinone reductase (H+-translocating)